MKNLDHNAVLRVHPTAIPNVDFFVRIIHEGGIPELVWLSETLPHPTEQELTEAIVAERAEIAANQYKHQRAAEYPPLSDLADALVKKASADAVERASGEAQEAAYIAACQAVKAKYPKP